MEPPHTPETTLRRALAAVKTAYAALPDVPEDASPHTSNKRQQVYIDTRTFLALMTEDLDRGATDFDEGQTGANPTGSADAQSTLVRARSALDRRKLMYPKPSPEEELFQQLDWDTAPLSARAFKTMLLDYPYSGSLPKAEAKAFGRLLAGYQDSATNWVCTRSLAPILSHETL